ncbi:MAG: metallopeptidase TldD-related protein [Kofleriaceae bacterium]
MISRRALVSALVERRITDWIVVERDQELALVTDTRQRTDDRTRWVVVVHQDVPRGRGSARLEIGALDGSARDQVDQALALALSTIGPPWRSTLPAAPAKVDIADLSMTAAALDETATQLLAALPRPAGATVSGEVELLRERVTAHTSQGLRTAWTATHARASALVSVGANSLELARESRRIIDLDLAQAIPLAVVDLALLGSAGAPRPGRCALILRSEALLHGGGLGVWSVFEKHASAELERQGLVRYRGGAPIVPGADQIDEPLSVMSDGALDFATLSSPLGDEGDAVRRFPLVERGVASGLGMSMREAARRQAEPNGGVRNLVVASGSWADVIPPGRSLDVRRLRSLSIDPYTGDASLEIALAIDRDGGGERAITGGLVRIDLVAALARARRSATPLRRGSYLGPASILIDDAEVLV